MANKKRRLEQRCEEAALRKAERDARTHEEQLKRLDAMLGAGVGAKKERARLEKLIEASDLKKRRTKKEKESNKTKKANTNKTR